MPCLLLFRSSVFCFILFLLLQVSIFSSIAAAGVQSDCDLAAEDLRREQAKLKDTANPPDLEDTLQRLRHITDICPNLADGWYFRGRVEQKLGKPADYSLEKARRLNSPALKDNLDPFSPNVLLNNSGQSTTTGKDSSAPQITIISPVGVTREQTVRVKTCQITLKGRVTDESPIRDVEVNGAPVSLDGKNEFSTNLALQSGSNRIFVTATDVPGNKAREEFGVACENALPPPTLATNSTSPPPENSNKLDYDESHALIIGVSHYTNGWRDLPGVQSDVNEVSAALQKHGFQITIKLDLKQAELDRALRDFVGTYGQRPKNRLVIYFAGHGHTLMTNDGRPLGYIVPADAPLPDKENPGPFKSLAISMSDIEKFAREIESKHALFVFDSCFSGSLFRVRSNSVPDSISAMTDEQVRLFITAGTEKQAVPDESVFRRQFVKALAGEADYDKDGFVTGSELGYFLRNTVTDYTKKMQTPESGKIRDPDLDKGDIVFDVKKVLPQSQNPPKATQPSTKNTSSKPTQN